MTASPNGGARRRSTPDRDLMREAQAGSSAAFGVLYDRYARRAYRVARTICGNEHQAEDVVQEAFLSMWRRRASFDPSRGEVGAWLLTVVRHRALDVVRHSAGHARRRAAECMLDSVPAPGDTAEQVAARADARDLREKLARLPDAQRDVVALAYFGQLTQAEISSRLDLALGTVKGRARLGLDKLRTTMEAT